MAITLLDGLVASRTALHHSANYRSLVAFGRGETVTDEERKRQVLERTGPVRRRAPTR